MMLIWALVLASTVVLSSGQVNDGACLRFGGSACCPYIPSLDREIQEVYENQPRYVTFLPKNEDSVNIDNICYTFFPVPDRPNVFVTYISRVYSDGQNQVRSFILAQPEPGIRNFGNGLCHFVDTIIAYNSPCSLTLVHRCINDGDCPFVEAFDSPSGLFGVSSLRKPTTRACISQMAGRGRNEGLPNDEFHILPMKLPSRCVLNRVCSVLPTVQRFCQTVGIAFPNLNCEQRVF